MREGELNERERERERRRGPKIGSGRGASALGTLTSGRDMTRHAGSAQLGQRSALPCCFGLALSPPTNTQQNPAQLSSFSPPHIETHTLHAGNGAHERTPKMPRFWREREQGPGEGPGLMETPNWLL